MEIKLGKNIQPNNNLFSLLKRLWAFIKKAALFSAGAVSGAWKKIWNLLCKNKRFAHFAYVIFPPARKKTLDYIKEHRQRIIIATAVMITAFAALLVLTRKDTVNSDYYTEGNDNVEFGMRLQNYSTFDHSEITHIAVHLSWNDGAVDLSDGIAKARIKAKVFPVNLPDDTITWNTSDWDIATIDQDGNITATNPGKVKITAALASEGKTSEATLEIRQPVSGIFMPTTTVTMYAGGAGRLLKADVFPANATNSNVTWKSKDNKIARVDSEGNVRPVSAGMTEIIASTEDGGFEAKCFVNVINPYVDVKELSLLNAEDMQLRVGDSINAIISVSPSNARNKTLKWSSDNEDVAVVSQTGRIRGVSEGTANITVESVNGKQYAFEVAVGEGGKDPFILADDEESKNEGGVTYTSYDTTFPQAVRIQMAQDPSPKIWTSGGNISASEAQTAEYMNPNNYYTDAYKYQFLDLSKSNNLSEEVLNDYLEDKGVLRGMGAAFIEAAREYNVSEVYLIAHACLESGNGTSRLARGIEVNGTTVYNLYGINAYDNSEDSSGSNRAYQEGWTSVEKAIIGGAGWISEHYINSGEGRQNTLYKMRWNPENPGYHEYATDIAWAVKQAVSIEKIFSSFADAQLSFDIPVYSGQIPPTIEY